MTIKFYQLEYMKVYQGNGLLYGQADAQHAKPPEADLFTGRIVENLVEKVQCAGIISTVSRTEADLNRKANGQNDAALKQYRTVIKEILQHLHIFDEKTNKVNRPYLHLTIHGMKDSHFGPHAIEIGTFKEKSCSKEMKAWFLQNIKEQAEKILPQKTIICHDEVFDGDESIIYHRHGEGKDYPGYGANFHTFQLEFSKTLREKYSTEIVELLAYMMKLFQAEIVRNQ